MRSIHQDINPPLLTQWRMYFWHNSPAAVCHPLQVERGYWTGPSAETPHWQCSAPWTRTPWTCSWHHHGWSEHSSEGKWWSDSLRARCCPQLSKHLILAKLRLKHSRKANVHSIHKYGKKVKMISKGKKIIMGISLLFQRIKIDRPG